MNAQRNLKDILQKERRKGRDRKNGNCKQISKCEIFSRR